jgi:hypothetical protein
MGLLSSSNSVEDGILLPMKFTMPRHPPPRRPLLLHVIFMTTQGGLLSGPRRMPPPPPWRLQHHHARRPCTPTLKKSTPSHAELERLTTPSAALRQGYHQIHVFLTKSTTTMLCIYHLCHGRHSSPATKGNQQPTNCCLNVDRRAVEAWQACQSVCPTRCH